MAALLKALFLRATEPLPADIVEEAYRARKMAERFRPLVFAKEKGIKEAQQNPNSEQEAIDVQESNLRSAMLSQSNSSILQLESRRDILQRKSDDLTLRLVELEMYRFRAKAQQQRAQELETILDSERRIRRPAVVAYLRYLYRLAQAEVGASSDALVASRVSVLFEENRRAEDTAREVKQALQPLYAELDEVESKEADFLKRIYALDSDRPDEHSEKSQMRSTGEHRRQTNMYNVTTDDTVPLGKAISAMNGDMRLLENESTKDIWPTDMPGVELQAHKKQSAEGTLVLQSKDLIAQDKPLSHGRSGGVKDKQVSHSRDTIIEDVPVPHREKPSPTEEEKPLTSDEQAPAADARPSPSKCATLLTHSALASSGEGSAEWEKLIEEYADVLKRKLRLEDQKSDLLETAQLCTDRAKTAAHMFRCADRDTPIDRTIDDRFLPWVEEAWRIACEKERKRSEDLTLYSLWNELPQLLPPQKPQPGISAGWVRRAMAFFAKF